MAEDRPAIGAARLDAMFDGLRREVVLGVSAPPSAEVVRRGMRRRRRRAGVVAVAGVLGVAVLWSVASVVPAPTGHGVAGYPVPPTAAAPRPTVDLPFPEPRLSGPPSMDGAVQWASLESAEAAVRALVLDASRLPSVLGGYGPWTVPQPEGPFASGSLGQLTAPTSSAGGNSAATGGTSPSGSPSGRLSGSPSGSRSGPAASSSGGVTGTPGAGSFADGCVSRLVRTAGAEQLWGQRYVDAGHPEASALQVVMRFGSPLAAEYQATRLMRGGECVSSGAGWTVEQQVGAVVSLGVRQPVAYAEEVAVHISGTMVAVLTVRRGGRGVTPAAGLSDPFRASAEQFLQLRASDPEVG
ncbi:hypothetical protein TR51_23635 [Kitasatospora griseola]|uniref:PknH-like extracellular domain-containing protein n=1 Tax=Kitasatospora griseola TaxID=2064 RepID=A0A0D0N260_KITGR|nr:hypothetical protein TR51_23635 [Kitasatospora griseola]